MRDEPTATPTHIAPEPVIDLSTAEVIDDPRHPYDAAEQILGLAA